MGAIDFLMWWLSPIIAIVYVVGYSLLFEPIRKWKRLPTIIAAFLDCPMCIGFWAGVFVGAMNYLPVPWPAWLSHLAIGGCLGIALEYILELMWRK
jgi:hypothetical protein